MLKADVFVDAEFGCGLAKVRQDVRAIGNRLCRCPWLEAVAKCVHVTIGANAGIAEQIPRAAHVVAALEDHIGTIRAFLLEEIAGADSRDSGTNNNDIKMFHTPTD